MLISAQEQLEVLRRLKASLWVSDFAPRLSTSYSCGLSYFPEGYNTGCVVLYEDELHQIVTTTSIMKRGRPEADYGSTTGSTAFFLKKFGSDSLVGPIWFEQIQPMNEMETLAIAALTDEEIERFGGRPSSEVDFERHMGYDFESRMTALCVGRCEEAIRGPIRHKGDPEWSAEDWQGFADFVWSLGWHQNGNQIGTMFWWCSNTPCMRWNDDYCSYTDQWQGKGPDPRWYTYTDKEKAQLCLYAPGTFGVRLKNAGQPQKPGEYYW